VIASLRERIARARQSLVRLLRARLAWLTTERLDFNGERGDDYAFAVVIGREHYRERRKRYPIASRAELLRVIALETNRRPGVFARIGPLLDNVREVQFFELPDSFLAEPPRALFWIPESVVVSLTLKDTDVATISRGEFCYYVSRSGTNQLRGGAIVTPELFRMAAGVPLDGLNREFLDSALLPHLEIGLRRLSAEDWWSFRGPELQRTVGELWRPTTALIAGTALLYLGIATVYLHGTLVFRQWQLDRLGAEVTPLLAAQRRVDELAAERSSMKSILEARVAAWPTWEIATQVWTHEGSFSSIAFKDGEVVIEGRAPSAIKVLEGLDARKDVSTARFDSAVRQVDNAQQFVIRLRHAGRPEVGRGP
jgi:hypothetical protein